MHPLLARYMDFSTARQTLSRRAEPADLPPEERTYLRVADAFPEARDAVTQAREAEADHPDVVQPLMLLAAHTAATALEEDARLGPALARAREALASEGASPEQVSEFIASLLIEEAFGYEDEAQRFDADFVGASLSEVPQLARLTPEEVEALEHAFRGGQADPLRGAVVQALVKQAWGEGPAFINPEHVEGALHEAQGVVPKRERDRVAPALGELLELLHARGYVSAPRLARLKERLEDAAG